MQLHAIGSAIALLALAGCSAQGGDEARQENGVTAQRSHFGTLADDTPIEAVTLTNDRGVSARIITYGATLQSLTAPDRDGKSADVLLGYGDLASYVDKPNYFAVTVGRYANRTAGEIGRARCRERVCQYV